jgi:SRSO17 transposase
VARQCKGKWTKYFNCQVGVFLSYASTAGVTLLDRRLYLPQAWVDDPAYEKRRQHCGIPADTVFQPREALALDMLQTVVAAGSPRCRWMVADTSLACAPQFRKAVADLKLWYFVEPHRIPGVPIGGYGSISDSRSPNFQEQRRIMKGRNETVPVDVVARRIASEPAERPEPDVWAVLCQDVEHSTTTYLSNAPADICPTALMQMCNTCWLPPTCIETSKRLLGMGDYEVRSWRGWHHHMTLVILAHFFLVRMHMRQQPGPDNVRATPSEMDTRTSLER